MSALIPMLTDTALASVGVNPFFNARSTGQPSSILGNPTVGLWDDTSKAFEAIFDPITQGRSISQQEARNILKPLLFQNTLPVMTLYGAMTRGLPEYAPKPAP
jgi:hypothetical protein